MRKALVVGLVAVFHLSMVPSESRAQWVRTNGPYNARIDFVGAAGGLLLAKVPLLNWPYKVVARSMDGAATWTSIPTSSGLDDDRVKGLAYNGTDHFLATCDGVLRSPNDGVNWAVALGGVGCIYAIMATSTHIVAGAYANSIRTSSDGGASWLNGAGVPSNFHPVSLIAVGGTFFAAGAGWPGGILMSTNNGSLWTAVNVGFYIGGVYSLAARGTAIFAATSASGVIRSTDNGATWGAVNSGLPAIGIQSLVVAGSDIFAATTTSVYRSSDDGASWTSVTNALMPSVTALASDGSAIYVGTFAGGVFRSIDAGATWQEASNGLGPSAQIYSLAIREPMSGASTLFAATDGAGIYKSHDNGDSWSMVNGGLAPNLKVYKVAFQGSKAFAGTDAGGVLTYNEAGESWSASNSGLPANRDAFDLAPLPPISNVARIFANFGSDGTYRSNFGGASWIFSKAGPAVLASEKQKLIAIVGGTAFQWDQGNQVWNRISTQAFNERLEDVQAATIIAGQLYAGTRETGVHRLESDQSWASVNSGLTNLNILSLAPCGSNLFAGTAGGGVFLTRDKGATWTSVSEGLDYDGVRSLTISKEYIFAGTIGGGVWRRPLTELFPKAVYAGAFGSAMIAGRGMAGRSATTALQAASRFYFSSSGDVCNGNAYSDARPTQSQLCDRYPALCGEFVPELACERYPQLCEQRIHLPRQGGIPVQFREAVDRAIVRVDGICRFAMQCPGGENSFAEGYVLTLTGTAAALPIHIYDSTGRLVHRDTAESRTKMITLATKPDLEYYMVLKPGANARLNARYTLSLSVAPIPVDTTGKRVP